MKTLGLSSREVELLNSVFRRHPEITEVRLFGSRAKGSHRVNSDIDLAVWGDGVMNAPEKIVCVLHDRRHFERCDAATLRIQA